MGFMLDFKILFIFIVPIWIVIRSVLCLKKRSNRQLSIKREIVLNIFFIYILCLIAITLFPLKINWDGDISNVSINVVPVFNTMSDFVNVIQIPEQNYMIKFWIKNIIGNMLLLFPLGLLLPILWRRFNNMITTVLISFLFSLGIEIIQLLSSYVGNVGRAFDIDDIILNTLGAWLGYVFYKKILLRLINKSDNTFY
jgi:glycopeptide antibiotics resistance protein